MKLESCIAALKIAIMRHDATLLECTMSNLELYHQMSYFDVRFLCETEGIDLDSFEELLAAI